MNRQVMRGLAVIAATAGLLFGFQNCAKVGDPRQPGSGGSSDSKSGGTTTDNPKATLNISIIDSGGTATGSAQLCLGQIRFSNGSSSLPQIMNSLMQQYTQLTGVNLALNDMESYLTTVPLAPGTYTSVDLGLDQNCAFGSLSVPTNTGTLNLTEPVTLHFVGSINTAQSGELVLDIKDILAALVGTQSAADVQSILATVSGTF